MCSCGGSSGSGTAKSFVHIAPNGKKTAYAKEGDARMAAAREGGEVKPGK